MNDIAERITDKMFPPAPLEDCRQALSDAFHELVSLYCELGEGHRFSLELTQELFRMRIKRDLIEWFGAERLPEAQLVLCDCQRRVEQVRRGIRDGVFPDVPTDEQSIVPGLRVPLFVWD